MEVVEHQGRNDLWTLLEASLRVKEPCIYTAKKSIKYICFMSCLLLCFQSYGKLKNNTNEIKFTFPRNFKLKIKISEITFTEVFFVEKNVKFRQVC